MIQNFSSRNFPKDSELSSNVNIRSCSQAKMKALRALNMPYAEKY